MKPKTNEFMKTITSVKTFAALLVALATAVPAIRAAEIGKNNKPSVVLVHGALRKCAGSFGGVGYLRAQFAGRRLFEFDS